MFIGDYRKMRIPRRLRSASSPMMPTNGKTMNNISLIRWDAKQFLFFRLLYVVESPEESGVNRVLDPMQPVQPQAAKPLPTVPWWSLDRILHQPDCPAIDLGQLCRFQPAPAHLGVQPNKLDRQPVKKYAKFLSPFYPLEIPWWGVVARLMACFSRLRMTQSTHREQKEIEMKQMKMEDQGLSNRYGRRWMLVPLFHQDFFSFNKGLYSSANSEH